MAQSENNNIKYWYTQRPEGPGGFGSVVMRHDYEDDGKIGYPQFDAVGNTIGVMDNSGNLIASPVHGAFGKVIRSAGVGDGLGDPLAEWGGEQGYMYFADLDLYYVRQRWYDPSTRQWLSPDPTGVTGDDTNLYRYVRNSPVSESDPSGLDAGMLKSGPEWEALLQDPSRWKDYKDQLGVQQLDALANATLARGDGQLSLRRASEIRSWRKQREDLSSNRYGVSYTASMLNVSAADRAHYRWRGVSRASFSLAALIAYRPRSVWDAWLTYPFLIDQLQAGVRETYTAEEVKSFGGSLLGRLDYKLEILYDLWGPMALRGLRVFGRTPSSMLPVDTVPVPEVVKRSDNWLNRLLNGLDAPVATKPISEMTEMQTFVLNRFESSYFQAKLEIANRIAALFGRRPATINQLRDAILKSTDFGEAEAFLRIRIQVQNGRFAIAGQRGGRLVNEAIDHELMHLAQWARNPKLVGNPAFLARQFHEFIPGAIGSPFIHGPILVGASVGTYVMARIIDRLIK